MSDAVAETRIVVRRNSIARALGIAATLFLLTDLLIQTIESELAPGTTLWPHIVRFVDMNSETSLPTWYSVVTLAFAGLLTAGIALEAWKRADRFKWHWFLATVLIIGFSIDEGAQIHDTPEGVPLRDIIGTSGLLYYAWVIPAFVSVLVVALIFARFIFALPGPVRLLFILSAVTFLAGAIGMEMISGWYADRHPGPNLGYWTLSSIEEYLEMLGVVMLIAGLLEYASRRLGHTDVIWKSASNTP